MKKVLYAILAILMLMTMASCSGNAVEEAANAYFAEGFSNPMISWEDLFAKIDAGDAPYILSIRSADDYAAGHIDGAYLASWNGDLAEKVSLLPTDQTVYVYCYSGQTAGQTVGVLRMLGVDAVSVKSGYNVGATAVEGYEAYVAEGAAPEMTDAGASFDKDVLAFAQDYFAATADNANFKITAEDTYAKMEAGEELQIVDIRQADAYAEGHVDGAVNIPFGAGMDFSSLSTDSPTVVYCYSGQTAGQTTAVLRALGYDAVSMHFGMKGWTDAELPVVAE